MTKNNRKEGMGSRFIRSWFFVSLPRILSIFCFIWDSLCWWEVECGFCLFFSRDSVWRCCLLVVFCIFALSFIALRLRKCRGFRASLFCVTMIMRGRRREEKDSCIFVSKWGILIFMRFFSGFDCSPFCSQYFSWLFTWILSIPESIEDLFFTHFFFSPFLFSSTYWFTWGDRCRLVVRRPRGWIVLMRGFFWWLICSDGRCVFRECWSWWQETLWRWAWVTAVVFFCPWMRRL